MHSGIGPKEHMEKFNLPVVKDIPAVGQGLRDHMFCPLVYTRKEGNTARAPFYGDQAAMDAALEQWRKDGTGDWSKFACEVGIGFFKSDRVIESEEFKALPAEEQAYLTKETVPHYEILTHFPVHWFIPDFPKENLNYSCLLVFYMNAQARGQVTLQSADPNVPLKHDPKFFSEPFDRRVAIEALRDALRFTKSEGYAKNTIAMMAGPKGDSDEDLIAYWEQTLSSSWHMTGTVKMGKPGDLDAAVDSDFRVMGIDNLRVADMSVVPVLPNCHVQAVAYVTGATCAEKLVAEYNLA
jgi:choline dehydrogenase-like flavoprotein